MVGGAGFFGLGGTKTLKQSDSGWEVTDGLKTISSPRWMIARWFFSSR